MVQMDKPLITHQHNYAPNVITKAIFLPVPADLRRLLVLVTAANDFINFCCERMKLPVIIWKTYMKWLKRFIIK